jgi:hypothetical protein
VLALLCAAAALSFNSLRRDGIPVVQGTEYEILVPCPETLGEADPIPVDSPLLSDPRTLLLDARDPEDHARWHPPGAWNVPFDYLSPTDKGVVRRIAASRAARVVVFGDGADPDSGEQLAREIAGRGIRNVGFIPGGWVAFRSGAAKGGAR